MREHAPALFTMLSDAELARFTPRKPLQRVGDAVELIRSVGLDFATRRSVRWGACLEPDGPIVATVGLHDWDRYHRHVSIGFDVDRDVAINIKAYGHMTMVTIPVMESHSRHNGTVRFKACTPPHGSSRREIQTHAANQFDRVTDSL